MEANSNFNNDLFQEMQRQLQKLSPELGQLRPYIVQHHGYLLDSSLSSVEDMAALNQSGEAQALRQGAKNQVLYSSHMLLHTLPIPSSN